MASDIPTAGAMGVSLLIDLATQGISAIFNAFHKKGAAAAAQAGGQLAVSLLQKTAEIQGLTIDWTDSTAVQAYIQSLPDFVPIPEPAPTAAPPATPPAKS